MYSYIWDSSTNGYILTNETGKFVANEIRPVFAEELIITELADRLVFNRAETRPLMWALKNVYYYKGEKVIQLEGTQYGRPLSPTFFFEGNLDLQPVEIDTMIRKNAEYMDKHVRDTKIRAKELYDKDIGRCDIAYIAFSGGKDSVVLLDICNSVLPNNVPVIFSDTDMELPDSYKVWEQVQERYPDREFQKVCAENSALENWRLFGPPSRTIRWCCSVHKSAPALVYLRDRVSKERKNKDKTNKKASIIAMAFTGVRQEESNSRAEYSDASDGMKAASQINRMPIVEWGAHELWLYIFANNLIINGAYRKGLARVGCIMCPESSDKYVWYVDKAYPGLLKPYNDVIIETSAKTFVSKSEEIAYVGGLGWQARKSGVVLKDFITKPIENIDGHRVNFKSQYISEELFFEWIKALGDVEKMTLQNGQLTYKLVLPKTIDDFAQFRIISSFRGAEVEFEFRDDKQKNSLLPLVRSLLKKSSACINCRACEVECIYGAISSKKGRITIDAAKCRKCLKCFEIDNACWRFKSMYKSETEKSTMSGINRYNNFGLREDGHYNWVSTLVELGDNYFPWHNEHPQGKKMVESASAWFQQAGLVHEKTRKPSSLVELFKQHGTTYQIGWDFIWISLANNAAIVRWFISTTQIGVRTEIEHLYNSLSAGYPSLGKSTIEGGLAAFKDMISKSPLGGNKGMVSYELKGKSVIAVMRKAKDISQLVILYGLYLFAQKVDRSSFTVRELLTSDENSICVSPLVAFGVPTEEFKLKCQGLQTKYPNYISCTFTHGLDELTVYPQKYSSEDIIDIALGE